MTAPRRVVVDTNLLILLVTGRTSLEYIGKHKNLRTFALEDYATLTEFIGGVEHIFLTPNVLAETSSLAGQIGDPIRRQIRTSLRLIIENAEEKYVESRAAVAREEYAWLGLTDASLLELSFREKATILSTDLMLCHTAAKLGLPAVNFNHLREKNFE